MDTNFLIHVSTIESVSEATKGRMAVCSAQHSSGETLWRVERSVFFSSISLSGKLGRKLGAVVFVPRHFKLNFSLPHLNMRPLTEDEQTAVFSKLANYIVRSDHSTEELQEPISH